MTHVRTHVGKASLPLHLYLSAFRTSMSDGDEPEGSWRTESQRGGGVGLGECFHHTVAAAAPTEIPAAAVANLHSIPVGLAGLENRVRALPRARMRSAHFIRPWGVYPPCMAKSSLKD